MIRTIALLLSVLLAGTGCRAAAVAPALVQYTSVDLSHTLTQDMPHLPATATTRIERDANGKPQTITLDVTSGTSLHLLPATTSPRWTVENLSPDSLLLPAVVIDLREQAQDTPGYPIRAADLQAWEQQHGRLPAGGVVLLLTGWDVRWGDPAAYLNQQADLRLAVPHLHPSALELLRLRDVQGIGIDTPLISQSDPAPPERGWLLLSNLTRLEQLPPTGATLLIGVLKVQGSSVSPAMVRGLVPIPNR